MGDYIIGVDLGGTSAKLAIATPSGELKYKWNITTDNQEGGKYIVPSIIQSLQRSLDEHDLSEQDILGIGMGSPGAVNVDQQTVVGAYNLNWTHHQAVGRQFKEAFPNTPFFIDNDANVAALGEQWLGAGNGADHVVTLTIGTGIGGGIVIDGQLYRGSQGMAGEVGHITVDPDSPLDCTCGKPGCFEALASAKGVVNLAKLMASDFEEATPFHRYLESTMNVTSFDLFEAAKKEDAFALKVVNQVCKYIGLGVSHIANTLNPSVIVLGGGMSLAGEFMLERVRQYYQSFTFKEIKDSTHLVLAELGNDAGVIGAINLVNTEILGK